MNSDQLPRVRDVRRSNSMCEPVVISSGMIDFTATSENGGACSMDHQSISQPPGSRNWRNVGAQRSDWAVDCASGWLGNQNRGLLSDTIMNSVSDGYDQEMRSSLNNSPNDNHSEGMQFTSMFQSSLQDVVTIATIGVPWPAGGNELPLLPAYGNQMYDWSNRAVQNYPHQYDGEFNNVSSDRRTQGLSLTLSSNPQPQPRVFHLGEGYLSGDLPSRDTQLLKDRQDFKDFNSLDSAGSIMPKSITSVGSSGKCVKDDIGTDTLTNPSIGPFGPFTGYATILKSSKFLKPAQQLLDEFCSIPGSKVPERITVDDFDESDHQTRVMSKGCGRLIASSSTLCNPNGISAGESIGRDQPRDSYQQEKARLVYMHEEVSRRYKQYHQQMQMVVSSFESVAGLSAATPYVSLAVKTVTRHFRCLRSTISDQLRHIRKVLGEDFMFQTSGNTIRQKYEQNFQKHKSAVDSVGFVEPQQHIWRPQRGLPERSVAILRTWLFDHFLHPYPTDTDKHMLATQTGLSRNQVSNWFINARVRVWKPMVEEIHMLETNGLEQSNKNEGNQGTSCSNGEESGNKVGFPGMGSSSDIGVGAGCEQWKWGQEKRSRVEPSIDRPFMGFMPYPRGGMEMGGIGAVSLTLGLRHSAENAQQQQQYLKHQEDELIQRQFGGHMFHDFVG